MTMKKKVTVVDDTMRTNATVTVTPQIREKFRLAGKPLPKKIVFLPAKDQKGRQVQNVLKVKHVFEGAHLAHAVRRAKRFMRSARWRTRGGTPRHIALYMAAFRKADRKGFDEVLAS